MEHIQRAYAEALENLRQFQANPANIKAVGRLSAKVVEVIRAEGRVFTIGNGGSYCDAQHFSEELTGRYRRDRRPLAAIAPPDGGHITCSANDFGFDKIFSRTIEALGRKGDLLIALSTSGQSPNIIQATQTARRIGMFSFALLGKGGGELRSLADDYLWVPGANSDRIQELHMQTLHIVVEQVERELFPENYR